MCYPANGFTTVTFDHELSSRTWPTWVPTQQETS